MEASGARSYGCVCGGLYDFLVHFFALLPDYSLGSVSVPIRRRVLCSVFVRHNQHVVGHHIYTNVFEADPDLPVAPKGDLRRLVAKQVRALCSLPPHHRHRITYYLFYLISLLA